MAISKEEIQKYIFDPKNPNQCKSYKLLLNIAQKDNASFFSPEFLQYFFGNEILNDDFKNAIWDIPDNYDSLTSLEKIELYKTQLSVNDFKEFLNNFNYEDINIRKIEKYSFFEEFIFTERVDTDYVDTDYSILIFINDKKILKKDIFDKIPIADNTFSTNLPCDEDAEYNKNCILFSLNYFDILKTNITKSSIFITLEKNIDSFLEYDNTNIKPIFLKKIEDIYLLLDVLENDIKKNKSKNIDKKPIYVADSINIKNFFSIKNIKIDNLKNKKEIYILGENGDGKTLFLQAIACGLTGVEEDGKGIFRAIKNDFDIDIVTSDKTSHKADNKNIYENLLAYGSNRNHNCQTKEDASGYMTLFNGEFDLKDPIKWLIILDHSESKNETNIISVAKAKEIIRELLNKDVDIEISSKKVTFSEKQGLEVEFDRLSAGYKGVITIVCDMIIRLSENQPHISEIKEYQGIVLIDEVELHLHPRWQYNFMKKLRELFPLIQFIVTTHSPTILLGASSKAVFYRIEKDNGNTNIKLIDSKNDFLFDIQNDFFGFDSNIEKLDNPDKNKQEKSKKALLEFIEISKNENKK